ncbi:hypothetical protein ACJJIG_18575 [Microbulbifer sp. SSSA007]|uniref:hypothetical protein n=1 Tax=Microbulbifer sp. SSSA007 TaxID=3243379 RepID=UPI00403A3090
MGLFGLGLSNYDIALLIFCPIGAVIGSFAFAIVETIAHKPPTKEDDFTVANEHVRNARGIWLGLRMILGGILGLVLGLYFVGAIQETVATLTKIVALSIFAGYSAPNIWLAQEEAIANKVAELLKKETVGSSDITGDQAVKNS